MSALGPILAVDTSTRASIVTVGRETPLATSRREVRHRHGSHLLEQIDEVLAEAGLTLTEVEGLAVGTGPGSFTGLRVGLATVKTMAYARGLPLAGVTSSDALRAAAGAADAVVVLPAGARDHYLSRVGTDPLLVAPGGLTAAVEGDAVIAVDMDAELLGEAGAARGVAALAQWHAANQTAEADASGAAPRLFPLQYPIEDGGIRLGEPRQLALATPELLQTPKVISNRVGSKSFGIWGNSRAARWYLSNLFSTVPLGGPDTSRVQFLEIAPAKAGGFSGLEVGSWSLRDAYRARGIAEAIEVLRATQPHLTIEHHTGYDV